jgi:hypothetical protein
VKEKQEKTCINIGDEQDNEQLGGKVNDIYNLRGKKTTTK